MKLQTGLNKDAAQQQQQVVNMHTVFTVTAISNKCAHCIHSNDNQQ
jgi:hypothetical protein